MLFTLEIGVLVLSLESLNSEGSGVADAGLYVRRHTWLAPVLHMEVR